MGPLPDYLLNAGLIVPSQSKAKAPELQKQTRRPGGRERKFVEPLTS